MKKINWKKRYDDILDIKPLYGYNRNLNDIKFNQVGLEIEIAVNYTRDRYTFIKRLISNIKKLIGKNGYFVKDATIIGDYNFEIVLDPLTPTKIKTIYSKLLEIIEISQGSICLSKENNCGIHLNFNQYDILDKEEAHKRLNAFALSNSEYFEENEYKQFVFKYSYDDYLKFQKKISNKYLWVNYLDSKLVEIRNVRVDLSPSELINLIKEITNALFYDKIAISNKKEKRTYKNLKILFEKSFQKLSKDTIERVVTKDRLLIISLDNKGPILIIPDKSLKEKIKRLKTSQEN